MGMFTIFNLFSKVTVSVVCPSPISYRGTWKPHMIIINQWLSETAYNTFYNSGNIPTYAICPNHFLKIRDYITPLIFVP